MNFSFLRSINRGEIKYMNLQRKLGVMAGHALQVYDVSILLATYVVVGLMITCLYLLRKDVDAFEYMVSYLSMCLLLISSTIAGVAFSYYVSDVQVSGIEIITVLIVFIICSLVTSVPMYYIVQRDLKKTIFIGTFSLLVIDMTVSFTILLGVRVSETVTQTLPVLGIGGGTGVVVFSSALGLASFVLSAQIEDYIIEISESL